MLLSSFKNSLKTCGIHAKFTVPRVRMLTNSSSSLEPIKFEIDEDMRRGLNKDWYWKNREIFVNNKELWRKFVLIDNTKVVKSFDVLQDAIHFQRKHLECFLTRVGDEDYKYRVLGTNDDKITGVLLFPEDKPPTLFETKIPVKQYVQKNQYVGSLKRPYVLLGISPISSPVELLPVWFLVDTGSPHSFIDETTAKQLFGSVPTSLEFKSYAHGCPSPIVLSLSLAHFYGTNLLGTDVIWDGSLFCHWKTDKLVVKFEEF